MSQRAIFVMVNGVVTNEILHHVPDREEMIQICKDMGYEACDNSIMDYMLVEYEWIEIGEGESDTDEIVSEETLLDIYHSGEIAETVSRMYNVEVETVEYGDEEILLEELEEE